VEREVLHFDELGRWLNSLRSRLKQRRCRGKREAGEAQTFQGSHHVVDRGISIVPGLRVGDGGTRAKRHLSC
jgi:hypothetical protein